MTFCVNLNAVSSLLLLLIGGNILSLQPKLGCNWLSRKSCCFTTYLVAFVQTRRTSQAECILMTESLKILLSGTELNSRTHSNEPVIKECDSEWMCTYTEEGKQYVLPWFHRVRVNTDAYHGKDIHVILPDLHTYTNQSANLFNTFVKILSFVLYYYSIF